MQSRPDLIGFGAVAVDDLLYLDNYPKPDSKIRVKKHLRLGGGLAGTALVAAARLGAKPAYFGVLGNNDLSPFTRIEFRNEKVNTDICVHKDRAKPLHSIILVDNKNGSRTILFSTKDFSVPSKRDISPNHFKQCRMIFIDTFASPIFAHVCEIAKSLNIPILADIEDIAIHSHNSVMDNIDHLIFNKYYAQQITGFSDPKTILNSLETKHRKATVITAGEKGCWFKEYNKPVLYLRAFPITAVDTTGCGDVFHGAYAAAILRGSSIEIAVLQAAAAAAIKATQPGGRQGIPNLVELQHFISKNNDVHSEEIC